MSGKLYLEKKYFGEKEKPILEFDGLTATAFTYSTGVEAVKLSNEKGYIGIASDLVSYEEKELTMKPLFDEPKRTDHLLKAYGCFLMHCGICAHGVPQKDDDHPLHGELPNIEYDSASINFGEDEKGKYIAVSGVYDYGMAFNKNYTFVPECRLYAGDTKIVEYITLTNNRSVPMDYMYLMHVNFRPIDGAELIYSAKYDENHIKVQKVIPDWMEKDKAKALKKYMDDVQKNPSLHHKVGEEGQIYDPEICFAVDYMSDKDGRAYTLQYKEGLGAFFVNHPVDALPVGVRWICRKEDEDAMGMVLPATAEHLGRAKAEKDGQIRILPAGETIQFYVEAGYLNEKDAKKTIEKIEEIRSI